MNDLRLSRFVVLPLVALLVAMVITVAPSSVGAASITGVYGTVSNAPAIIVVGTGFAAGEAVKITGQAPDSRIFNYPTATADGGGALYVSLGLIPLVNVQATGQQSGTQATLTLGPPPPNIPEIEVVFVGQPVGVHIGGLRPNETANIYIVDPNGTPNFIESVRSNLAGAAQANAFFPYPGIWKVAAGGDASGRAITYTFFVVPLDYRYG